MVTLGIFVLLAIAFYSGSRRGLALQLVYTGGYFISYLVAKAYYQSLGEALELFVPYPSVSADTNLVFFDMVTALELDRAFYAAVAFVLILFIGWIVTRFIGIFARRLMFIPILKQFYWLAGGVVSVVIMYIGIFIFLSLLSMIPLDAIQNLFSPGSFPKFMVEKTPIFSKEMYELWINKIIN